MKHKLCSLAIAAIVAAAPAALQGAVVIDDDFRLN